MLELVYLEFCFARNCKTRAASKFPFHLRIIKVHMAGSEYAKRYTRFITPTIAAYHPG